MPVDTHLPLVQPGYTDDFGTLIGNPDVDVELAISQIPALFGTSDMATFLSYRALGYSTLQALRAMDKENSGLYNFWVDNCPEFLQFEFKYLSRLQKVLSKNIIRLTMIRNMAMCMGIDYKVIQKAHDQGMDTLEPREYDWLKNVRPRYSTTDLLAIEKIISPEDYRGGDTVVNLTWDTRTQKIEITNSDIPELVDGSRNS